jgi:plasmid stabilization system protein ParE
MNLHHEQEWSRLQRLWDEIDAAEDLLGQFPEAGVELAQEGAMTVRRLRLKRIPFYVWYIVDLRKGGGVTLFRLFHARQLTPEPHLR